MSDGRGPATTTELLTAMRRRATLARTWGTARASSAGSPASTTRSSAGATSSPRSSSSRSAALLAAADARCSWRAPDNDLVGAGPLQPALHHARHDDDVPVRRAGDGGACGLSRAADGRHAQHRLPAAQRLQLLGLPVRRAACSGSPSRSTSAPDAGWFAYVPLAGPRVSRRQARRHLGADDHLHRGRGARRSRSRSSSRSLKQRAPGMTLDRMPLFVWAMLVTVVHGHLRDAGGDARQLDADLGPAGRHALLQSGRRRRRRCCGSTCSGSSATPRSTSSSCRRWAWSSTIVATFTRRPIFGYPALVLALIATGFLAFGLWVHHMFATGLPQLGRASSPRRA